MRQMVLWGMGMSQRAAQHPGNIPCHANTIRRARGVQRMRLTRMCGRGSADELDLELFRHREAENGRIPELRYNSGPYPRLGLP